MDAHNKLDIKLPSGASFSAEGSEELVRELFAQFMEVAKSAPAVTVPLQSVKATVGQGTVVASVEQPGSATQLDRALLDRLFKVDGENVSLLALPKGEGYEGEALLAILYGFSIAKNQSTVTAFRLMKAARQSGISGIKPGRVMDRQFITESGTGKSKKYGLNNPGMRHAEDVLRGILD